MGLSEAIDILEADIDKDAKIALADTQSVNAITHSPIMKDWFFSDGSILRMHVDDFYVLGVRRGG